MYRLGIDLGGTNIVAGVVDENYEIIAKASCKTNVPRPESEICDSMADVALKAIEKAKLTIDDIESIGIGVPGAVNPKTGVIEYSANLFFHNWQVVKMMEERLNTKICVERCKRCCPRRVSCRQCKGCKKCDCNNTRHRYRRRYHY